MNDVDLEVTYPFDGHAVGDRVTVDKARAKTLVRGGAAVYATVKAAKAAGAPPEEAATKRNQP